MLQKLKSIITLSAPKTPCKIKSQYPRKIQINFKFRVSNKDKIIKKNPKCKFLIFKIS